jgi:hypothetical protein
LKFQPHFDGDFFTEDPAQLLKTAPPKPSLIGFTEAETGIYGE